ncbi:hypothetical protein B1A99_11940 [Cohnella sp. CIP 111063]|uniref:ABC transporter substrate-binding protein n=1 Tax=unclassified Cohnella TaxID=2636738 RepID=UPI000B8C1932|nr:MULTISPECIES: ABC transporter substrate-binding protein [unclassified Cohnella]OXS59325.1 hypothetical protein B1A99_11940 [Cohnella sp. CIP 111063]PRX72351.1 putative aldouronate transport system substrate-binding protein [Cohnella sp. SGD-V74]
MRRMNVAAIFLCVVLMLGACSRGGASQPNGNAAADEGVELTWYFPSGQWPDLHLVEAELNRIVEPLIHAKIRLKGVDWNSYEQKLNTMIAASDEFDIVWTSNWILNYRINAEKGAFLAIDDLLETVAPTLKASLPDFAWKDVKVKNKIYTVPNYQIAAHYYGFAVQKKYADKYGLDPAAIKTIEDIEPFLKLIKQNEPDKIPFGSTQFWCPPCYGISAAPSFAEENGVAHYKEDPNRVIMPVDTPEYRNYLQLARSWYLKGYIQRDIAVVKDFSRLRGQGNMVVLFDVMKPGGEAEEYWKNGGNEVIYIPMYKPRFDGVTPTTNAISRTSRHPEKAMELLELVNTDSRIFNLLSFGIEDKHYKKIGENTIRVDGQSGYAPNANWVFGNVMNGYLQEGQPADTWEQTQELNLSAEVDSLYGFHPDIEAYKTESANIHALEKEYAIGLNSGTLDPDQYYPLYLDLLRKAGIDKVREEQQRQLDIWLEAKP